MAPQTLARSLAAGLIAIVAWTGVCAPGRAFSDAPPRVMQRRIFRTISPIDAVGSAANSERNLAGFISAIGGVVLASDALYASPLRARLKLFLIDCNGHVAWHTYTTSNKVHNGTNVASGTTQLAENALRDSKDQFANRR